MVVDAVAEPLVGAADPVGWTTPFRSGAGATRSTIPTTGGAEPTP